MQWCNVLGYCGKQNVFRSDCIYNQIKRLSSSTQTRLRKKHDYGGCVENVRKRDYEGYLHCLVFPERCVRYAFAIKAFNLELAMVPDQTRSDLKIAQMRYKFWHDSIEQVFRGKSRFHPTLMELSFAVEKCDLSRQYFSQMIDSRSRLLERESFDSFESYTQQLAHVYSSMNCLLLQILKLPKDVTIYSDSVQELSRAQGLVNS